MTGHRGEHSFFDIFPPDDLPQVRTEAKAWAWQYLIEKISGLRPVDGLPPSHTEGQYLDDAERLSSSNASKFDLHQKIEGIFAEELNKILSTDWELKIKAKLSNVEQVLKEQRGLALTGDDFDHHRIKREWQEKLSCTETRSIRIYEFPKGWLFVEADVTDDTDPSRIQSKVLTKTRNPIKADRFFDIAVRLNEQAVVDYREYHRSKLSEATHAEHDMPTPT